MNPVRRPSATDRRPASQADEAPAAPGGSDREPPAGRLGPSSAPGRPAVQARAPQPTPHDILGPALDAVMARNDDTAPALLRALSEQDALHVIEHLYQLHHQPAQTLDPRVSQAATQAATEPEPGRALAARLAALVTAPDDPVLPGPRGGALPAGLRNPRRGPGGAVILFRGGPDEWPE